MRENPLPLLVLFLAVAALPSLARAQEQSPPATSVTVVETDDHLKARRLKSRLNHGPHRKNPLAAGRVRVINRMNQDAAVPTRGPLPRTRGHRSNSTFTTLHYERPRATRQQLSGPRYKNRKPAAAGGQG